MESSIAVFLAWHFACEQLSIQNVKREEGGTGSSGVLGCGVGWRTVGCGQASWTAETVLRRFLRFE